MATFKRPANKQECFERRKKLYEEGNLKTRITSRNGDNVYGGEGAEEYNWLARIHSKLPDE